MIDIDENAQRAITNARALLDAMVAGGWADVCVKSEEGYYFLARDPGTPNPLIAPAPVVPASPAAPASAAMQSEHAVKAPHVGTVVWLAPVGTRLAEGEAAARLAVLDQTVDVPAPVGGVVTRQSAQLDELAEFGVPLIVLAD